MEEVQRELGKLSAELAGLGESFKAFLDEERKEHGHINDRIDNLTERVRQLEATLLEYLAVSRASSKLRGAVIGLLSMITGAAILAFVQHISIAPAPPEAPHFHVPGEDP